MSIELFGLDNIPIVDDKCDISQIIKEAVIKQGCGLKHGDIVLIAETLISKAEENFIDFNDLTPSNEALNIVSKTGKDPKLVEAILSESNEILRIGPDFVISETKHGFVCANAGIDESNIGEGLLKPMPEDADKSARLIREFLEAEFETEIAVIITDTQGRAFRFGAVGTAIGCSGISPIWRRAGECDLYGRELQTTEIATCDELASAASLLMGQADSAICLVLIRGYDSSLTSCALNEASISEIIREKEMDVFR